MLEMEATMMLGCLVVWNDMQWQFASWVIFTGPSKNFCYKKKIYNLEQDFYPREKYVRDVSLTNYMLQMKP